VAISIALAILTGAAANAIARLLISFQLNGNYKEDNSEI
jgi:hypothetical protein